MWLLGNKTCMCSEGGRHNNLTCGRQRSSKWAVCFVSAVWRLYREDGEGKMTKGTRAGVKPTTRTAALLDSGSARSVTDEIQKAGAEQRDLFIGWMVDWQEAPHQQKLPSSKWKKWEVIFSILGLSHKIMQLSWNIVLWEVNGNLTPIKVYLRLLTTSCRQTINDEIVLWMC